VEDEDVLRDVICEILEMHGYQVILAGSGREALEKWAGSRDKIDLLLTDMMMPECVSGGQLAKALR